MKERLSTFEFNFFGTSSLGSVSAAIFGRSGSVHLTPFYNYLRFGISGRVSTLIHEARHSDGYMHTGRRGGHEIVDGFPITDSCTVSRAPQCDSDRFGPQSAVVVFLGNIIRHCENCEELGFVRAESMYAAIKKALSQIINPSVRKKLIEDIDLVGLCLEFVEDKSDCSIGEE